MGRSSENSPPSEQILKSPESDEISANIPNKYEARVSQLPTCVHRASQRTSRDAFVRKPRRREILREKHDRTKSSSRKTPQNSNRIKTQGATRSPTIRKPSRRKTTKSKSRTHESGDHRISVQKVKNDFRQLSGPDQRRLMEEMAADASIRGALPSSRGSLQKGLKIHSIKQCVVQIEPQHGEYFIRTANG